ncbi:glucose-1-phosphate thymidylyltransferase RfbA [Psychrobacillus sp. NPDC096389]|uniref:glucose-1-phosphate thymidylyltransferase RfbA n=1 Tax=Psychrobacillus sp. NPDC096389 TaxID=3364490 RepID=UPI0037F297A0
MKGIILAGGSGTRLSPITKAFSKHLLPIYDKPMIYYPLSVLMLAGIKEVLIITTERDLPIYKRLLNNGSQWGISIKYKIQESPNGIAEAFILGEEFIGVDSVCLILGDNIFYGQGFTPVLKDATNITEGAIVFGYQVNDPKRFGVVEFNNEMKVISIEEKPKSPKSNYAVTGLYFFDNKVINFAKKIKPSSRGELEITDINKKYLESGELSVKVLGRGFAWLDTGTFESLIEAGQFVQTIEKRQGYKIACLEEISYKNKWITTEQLSVLSKQYSNDYGNYLNNLAEEGGLLI